MDLENYDPLIERLEIDEQKVVLGILKYVGKRFPDVELLHQMKEPSDTVFSILLTGFKELDVNVVRRMARIQKASFRSYEIVPDATSNNIGVLLTFYRSKIKGQKPLAHEIKSSSLQFQNMKESLAETTLSPEEQEIAQQLAQQFCFVERYSSGNIVATVQDQGEYYELIFSNVKKITSGFVACYMQHFSHLVLEMKVTGVPFEIYVKVFRDTPTESTKKRTRDDSVETSNKKKK
jgi:hypothetical protein